MRVLLLILTGFFGIVIGVENQTTNLTCEKRYLQHYEVKDCTPVYKNDTSCPSFYKCPKEEKILANGCVYNRRVYHIGEEIDVGNPCEICSCFGDDSNKHFEIECAHVECFNDNELELNSTCYNTYEANTCCSIGTKCLTDEANDKENVCDYNGKIYHYGEQIYPEEDPCQICICNKEWSGIGGKSCSTIDCALDLDRKELEEGCIPIYHEATCCPIEYHCGTEEEGYKNTTEPLATQDDIESGTACEFKGLHYKLGQILDINHPTHCVTCTCQAPPIFTCIHKICPNPPNNDYDHCPGSFNTGECCPTYNCADEEPLKEESSADEEPVKEES
ncbi:von Willebrand factor C and EGF domain-containing protein [Parasteatoda tepidariorum]|uniref:von Willebrand factor C and EGF domain-containing protein n=1 Tax=Parasteatoda tepidariorum TaxID=114398 RepID=UPI00077FA26F|nr:von Willebrand factor C and EGF domain-containing protein [Parasteatoda tepidariorum]